MCITAAHARKQGSHEPAESYEGVAAKRAEEEVEPHDIGLQALQSRDEPKHARRVVE